MVSLRSLGLFAWGVVLLTAQACTGAPQRYPLIMSAPPHAAGSIQIESLEGGERLIVVELSDMPPPESVAPGTNAFVVWLLTKGGPPVRAGNMSYDRERRSGTLMATVPSQSFVVRITSEPDANIDTPSDVLVAEQAVAFNY